jgi:DNA-binding NarL/FixJ family response regulator
MSMHIPPLKRAGQSSQKSRTLLLVDPDLVSRERLTRVLEPAGIIIAVASAQSRAPGGLQRIDLSVLNLGPRGLADAEAKAEIACLRTFEVPLAVFVKGVRLDEIQDALRLGVRGYIPIFVRQHEILEGLRIMLDHGIFVPAFPVHIESDARIQRPLTDSAIDQCLSEGPLRLTLRENQILQLLRQDRTNREIADALNLAESTVKVHVRHILCALNAESRSEAVEIAERFFAECKAGAGEGVT